MSAFDHDSDDFSPDEDYIISSYSSLVRQSLSESSPLGHDLALSLLDTFPCLEMNRTLPESLVDAVRAGSTVPVNEEDYGGVSFDLIESVIKLGAFLLERGEESYGAVGEMILGMIPMYTKYDADIALEVGQLLRSKGRFSSAVEIFVNTAHHTDDETTLDASFLQEWGYCLLESGRYPEAVDKLQKSLNKGGNNWGALLLLAPALKLSGQYEKAVNTYLHMFTIVNHRFTVHIGGEDATRYGDVLCDIVDFYHDLACENDSLKTKSGTSYADIFMGSLIEKMKEEPGAYHTRSNVPAFLARGLQEKGLYRETVTMCEYMAEAQEQDEAEVSFDVALFYASALVEMVEAQETGMEENDVSYALVEEQVKQQKKSFNHVVRLLDEFIEEMTEDIEAGGVLDNNFEDLVLSYLYGARCRMLIGDYENADVLCGDLIEFCETEDLPLNAFAFLFHAEIALYLEDYEEARERAIAVKRRGLGEGIETVEGPVRIDLSYVRKGTKIGGEAGQIFVDGVNLSEIFLNETDDWISRKIDWILERAKSGIERVRQSDSQADPQEGVWPKSIGQSGNEFYPPFRCVHIDPPILS